ncbi:MAG: NAD(P)/FAD-dependent oxidoreductase [Cyanobacteria bacterium J06639_1]
MSDRPHDSSRNRIVIVGGGLAGLTCAKVLRDRGVENFILLESSDRPGGRVRTDEVEGFHLDRGFQVLFAAYPMVKRHLDLDKLAVRPYSPGAILVRDGKGYVLSDPFRDVGSLWPSLTNPLATLGDKLRVLALRAKLAAMAIADIWQQPDGTTRAFLEAWGFSTDFIRQFFLPFYGGIFLDPKIATSALLFQFYFKMLSEGAILTPQYGLGAISDQLAARCQSDRIRCHNRVVELIADETRVAGVKLDTGETIEGDRVILAADPPTVRRLLEPHIAIDPPVPTEPRSVTCLYFSSPEPLYRQKYLCLNANIQPESVINNCVQLSNISPALAPAGQHLLSVTVLGLLEMSEEALRDRCLKELQAWFPNFDCSTLNYLKQYRIHLAQFDQPPGIRDRLPAARTSISGLILAGDYTRQSSIDGAMASGEEAAAIACETAI